jgi:colicin import membrane protein
MEQEQRRLAAARAEREGAERRSREEALRQAYVAEVQATVERRWRKPEGIRAADEAVVLVRINPDTGRIVSFNVERCSGGTAFCDSVRQTMERLQSLPRPPDADVVRGGIRIRFSPEQG